MNWELIGKLGGGAEVQKIPAAGIADGYVNTEVIMHTVHVPEGETWLVVLSGDLDPNYTNNSGPQLFIGEVSIGPGLPRGLVGATAKATGTAEVGIRRNNGAGQESFDGHVYAVPLP